MLANYQSHHLPLANAILVPLLLSENDTQGFSLVLEGRTLASVQEDEASLSFAAYRWIN